MHRGVVFLGWLTLVTLAPVGASADDALPTNARPRTTRSALGAEYDGPSIPDDSSRSTRAMYQDTDAQPVPELIEPANPTDGPGEAYDDSAAEPGMFDSPYEVFPDLPNAFEPAPAVSSGNWLRNCGWYTEQSAVYLTRTASVKNDVRLAAEFITQTIFTKTLDVALDPGFEPGLRSTIGRYLGRDARNRTHSVEFTFLGLTHWAVGESVTAATSGSLFQLINPFLIDTLTPVPVYDGSDVQAFDQTSDFNSYEFNYRVERRLGRDQMVYSRDSHWVREATPTLLCSAFAGVRTVIVNERIDWTASSSESITSPEGTGSYVVVTHNNMVGPQVGAELFYERAYWRVGTRFNAGALVNWASQSSTVRILDTEGEPLEPNRDEFAKDHTLSFAGGLNFIGEYRFKPTFGLRVSYDLMWVTDLALAQNQITFFPSTPTEISGSHTLFFQGVSLGFEWYR